MDAVDWATAAEGLIEDIEALETTAAPLRAGYGSDTVGPARRGADREATAL
jgi:hypothetical protein